MKYQKNELVAVAIEDIGNEGFGIGKAEGFTLFVKDAVVGDVVEARIVKPKKNYAYARLEKVLEPSPFRVEPKCAYHRQCGGCQLQALSYEKQLEFKQDKIRGSLIRIGGFAPGYIDERMEPVVGMEEPFRYRNKAQYPVGTDRDGNVIAGFYAGRTHSIIANTDCLLGPVENRAVMEAVLEYMRENGVSAYDETSGTGLVRHVLIRKGYVSGEIMVCLVINRKPPARARTENMTHMSHFARETGKGSVIRGMGRRTAPSGKSITEDGTEDAGLMPGSGREFLPRQKMLLQKLAGIEGMASISVSIQTERTNVIMGEEVHTIWGKDVISDTIRVRDMTRPGWPYTGEELTFHISPLSFYQVNPVQTEKLYSLALEYAGLTGQETVWDLYCGIGTISLFLAGKAKRVCGVEVVPQAIEDAKENAARNGIGNAAFFVGKAEEVLQEFYHGGDGEDASRPDVVVVDPPRKGCDEACLRGILEAEPERIVYVSCDPATLARDLRVLCDGGYGIERVRGVDQFGMTVHVETVCLLSKLNVEHHIEVEINLDEMDLTKAESKATYEEIKEYVLEHSGLKVSSLYIAQVKEKCGIIERVNYNLPKSENSRQPKCPLEKEVAIREALEYFQMI
ncbi:23S rRNA (uracil(1939)-C(5))-methyltransferase RlmD [Acetatifactor aquisgranensis]|uniref:23S rRNA (uracil(1939)-C(5))-methyltransferase RlmD n=1 Tax=Acetatifactor aquisgranensis TaxID=2941233 RepID=UPI00203DACEE|nr:23S rRNA (uracil(1939)-C(5))-methyltransferase RlmD [Acetatifactor aquisgranensis]